MFKNQLELFRYIWETREHISEITGLPLYPEGHMLFFHQFLHVLPKGQYTKWKLNPDNIILARPEEHEKQERYPRFQELYQELKAKYNEENRINTFV